MRKKNQEIERKTINGGGGGMETLGILWHKKKTKFDYKHGCSK